LRMGFGFLRVSLEPAAQAAGQGRGS
jgi:hypothetical protein